MIEKKKKDVSNNPQIGAVQILLRESQSARTAHIHIDRDALSAKFWIQPVALAFNLGFTPRELRTLEAMTLEHQKERLEAWNEYFGT